jgi:septum formation protein
MNLSASLRTGLILASQSASRRAMLSAAGVDFEPIPSEVDEGAIKAELVARGQTPRDIALALATEKALVVSKAYPGRWTLGSDSIVSVTGEIYDKPCSRAEAADHLRRFSGQMMLLDSAAVLARDGSVIEWTSDDATLEVRTLSDDFIEDYLAEEWPAISGCVGCFRIEGLGIQLFDYVTGSHFTVLGMPLLPVLEHLRKHGMLAS